MCGIIGTKPGVTLVDTSVPEYYYYQYWEYYKRPVAVSKSEATSRRQPTI